MKDLRQPIFPRKLSFGMPTSTCWLAGVGLALMCAAQATHAQTSCNVGGTTLSFGQYNSLNIGQTPGLGTISVACNTQPNPVAVPVTVALATGGSNNFNQRRMTLAGSSNTLAYQLYTSESLAVIWGDGTAGTQTVSATTIVRPGFGSRVTLDVIGVLPAGQNVPRGFYTDVVTIILTF